MMRLSLSELSGFCIRAKPRACSRLASTNSSVWAFVLKGLTTRRDASSFFVSRKSASCGSGHVKVFFACHLSELHCAVGKVWDEAD